MTMAAPHRLTIRESRDEPGLLARLARADESDVGQALRLLDDTARRLRELLRLRSSPFSNTVGGSGRVDGVAGLLRLSASVELQVVPKFLDDADPTWQEDFFLLALFSQTGRILPREHIRGGHGRRGDLATLVGQTLAQMFWENHRRPIRAYRARLIHEFALEGDIDPIDLFVPPSDGYGQQVLQLRRDNEHNAAMSAAVQTLLPEVRDSETRGQLLRVQQTIGPQPRVNSLRPVRLPNRHRNWQLTYDLSLQILRGFGVQLQVEHLLTPGFVLRTWETWQALVEAALRTGLRNTQVNGQQAYVLGTRQSGTFKVTPDVVLVHQGGPVLVVDAKYRTREGASPSIAADDVYEALAFMRSTGTHRTVLLYPRPSDVGPAVSVGTATTFDEVQVGAERITALTVECRGLAQSNGYPDFCSRLASAIKGLAPVPLP
jgi:hypothetical protein